MPATYATFQSYMAAGAISQMTLGNQLVETTTFNTRLQPVGIQAAAGQTSSLLLVGYDYLTQHEESCGCRSPFLTDVDHDSWLG